jgi:hypothetical protein
VRPRKDSELARRSAPQDEQKLPEVGAPQSPQAAAAGEGVPACKVIGAPRVVAQI